SNAGTEIRVTRSDGSGSSHVAVHSLLPYHLRASRQKGRATQSRGGAVAWAKREMRRSETSQGPRARAGSGPRGRVSRKVRKTARAIFMRPHSTRRRQAHDAK